jgi:hypothetical protein
MIPSNLHAVHRMTDDQRCTEAATLLAIALIRLRDGTDPNLSGLGLKRWVGLAMRDLRACMSLP